MKNPHAVAMARKRWDGKTPRQRAKDTQAAREARWKDHIPKSRARRRKIAS